MIQTPWWQKLRSYFTNWLLLILKIQDSKALSERTISSLVELKVAGHFVNPQKSEVKSWSFLRFGRGKLGVLVVEKHQGDEIPHCQILLLASCNVLNKLFRCFKWRKQSLRPFGIWPTSAWRDWKALQTTHRLGSVWFCCEKNWTSKLPIDVLRRRQNFTWKYCFVCNHR